MLKYIISILLFIYGFSGYQAIIYADTNTDKIIAEVIADLDKELVKGKKESIFRKSISNLFGEASKLIYSDVKNNRISTSLRKKLIVKS